MDKFVFHRVTPKWVRFGYKSFLGFFVGFGAVAEVMDFGAVC